jgi:hypothetical protein
MRLEDDLDQAEKLTVNTLNELGHNFIALQDRTSCIVRLIISRRTCSTHGRDKKLTQYFCWETWRYNFKDPGGDEKKILKPGKVVPVL